jgi:hypothetical protein
MQSELIRDQATLKLRSLSLNTRAEPVLQLAGLLSEALALNAALLENAHKILKESNETAKDAQPADRPVRGEAQKAAREDSHPPLSDGGSVNAPFPWAGLERDSSSVRSDQAEGSGG